jgi:hypothetical protein
VASGAFLLGSLGAPDSGADLATGSSGTGSTASLSFAELGLQSSYTFATGGSSVTIQLPVPSALVPSTVTGNLIVPPDFGTGTIVVLSNGNFVASTQLPPNSDHQQSVAITLPLSGIPVQNHLESFTVSVQQAGGGVPNTNQSGTCGGSGILPLTATDLVANYSGEFASPTTVANFFPSVMTTLSILVPQTPTPAEEQTALEIAAAAVNIYALVPVNVQVVAWDGSGAPPEPSDPLARSVVVEQSATTGISLPGSSQGSRVMVIQGTSTTLPQQVSVLSSSILAVLQASSATVVKQFSTPSVSSGPQTFGQLGLATSATFAGSQKIGITLNQASLGGVVTGMQIDLLAAYTPVEQSAKANVEASVGGVVLANQELNGGGSLQLPITIPQPLISRVTDLTLTATYFPAGFSCTGISRTMTFTIDPRSTVTPSLSTGGVGGFTQLPQALVPSFQVSFDHDDVARLNAAVSTVCGFQRISPVLLHPNVVPLSTSKANSLPLLVVATASSIQGDFTAPLQYRGGALYSVASAGGGQVKLATPVAAIQAFDDTAHNRTVLQVTTTSSWDLVQGLFSYLGNTPTNWAALTGDVLAQGQNGTPVNLSVVTSGTSSFSTSSSNNKNLYLLALVVFLVIVAVLSVWATLRYRRRGPSTPPAEE